MLGMINSDQRLRQYLEHYPFTHRDADLMISFFKNGDLRQEPDFPYVALVSMHEDIIEYSIKSTDPKKFDHYPGESIQRARGIIQHQDSLMQIPEGCGWVK